MMTPTEIMKLSMSDYHLELMLRNRKCKINAVIVQTGNIYSQIDTKSARDCLSVFFKKSENDKRNPVTQLVQLQDKYREEIDEKLFLTYVSLDEMFSIYSNLTLLFSCPFHKWVLVLDGMNLEEFWQYTERILKLKFQRFAVHAKTMSNVVLTELMDKIPEKMEVIIDSDIPLDYSHPKALRFRSFKYTEARWLKIEDFFNIRNLCLIKLDRTNFDCSDVIKFLNYWSDCDEDMMEGIAMGLKEGTQIDEEEIIKIFIVISDNESSHSRFFMKARNIGNRKFVVGQLEFRENKVTFSALDPLKEDCLYEYSILELLHQKRDFEEKIRKMEKEFLGVRDAENIRKLQLELEIIEDKLTDLNRDYEIRNFET
ncbi:hypothetical protein B9Z55_004497 [Caenorhabditis nigoni]|uniref:F-box associated domain-containing protein n=1 Tax=Caenorhabditis nigoni TaxID=1611254 RepID=A0A2G5UXJ8_9PELO|nr:hypothetical protein B9Z55_004497 [Caenorhabditis nigoni]